MIGLLARSEVNLGDSQVPQLIIGGPDHHQGKARVTRTELRRTNHLHSVRPMIMNWFSQVGTGKFQGGKEFQGLVRFSKGKSGTNSDDNGFHYGMASNMKILLRYDVCIKIDDHATYQTATQCRPRRLALGGGAMWASQESDQVRHGVKSCGFHG